ncbi:MAG: MraY family glycosyltransferase [Candidatus Cloacimonadota bacterium]|nr:MraY family glycosyltransferase [Candidatus Cloacimonadota bacterium]
MIYEFVGVLIVSFLASYSLVPLMIKLALKINLVDQPNHRKVHKKVTPLIGGISIFVGFILISSYTIFIFKDYYFDFRTISYLVSATIIVILGVIDDKFGMQPLPKMIGQFFAAALFIYAYNLSHLFGPAYVTIPIILLWIIGLINALNFLDNMDGIISGMAAIIAIGFYGIVYLLKVGQLHIPAEINNLYNFVSFLSLIFAGSLAGFLPFNFNPAKTFLGDAGSMFIGYFLATIGLMIGKFSVNQTQSQLYYLVPVLLLSFAIFDISLVSFTRKRDGRRVSQGGKDHSTHRIHTAMGSSKLTALIVYVINVIIILVTFSVFAVRSELLLIISTIFFALVFLFFGRKLDQVPIVVTKNQLKVQNNEN